MGVGDPVMLDQFQRCAVAFIGVSAIGASLAGIVVGIVLVLAALRGAL